MSALTADRNRNMLPLALTGLVMVASGFVRAEIWLAFVGAIVFICAMLLMREASDARGAGAAQRSFALPASGHLAEAPSARGPGPAFRLCPVVPLRAGLEAHSWLGGLPRLPSDVEWPMPGGKPALFLAQLDCAHFPSRLWGGSGPRDGWLVIFAEQGAPGNCTVLHTATAGEERQPPAPLRYPGHGATRSDILQAATGRPAAIPRWPVEIRPADEAASAAPAPGSAAPPDLSDPAFQPFDWPSARLLLETVTSDLAWQRDVIARLASDAPDADAATAAFLTALGETLAHIAALRAELSAAEERGLPFSGALRSLLLRGLSSLSVDAPDTGAEPSGEIPALSLLEHDQIRRDYARWLDLYARTLYSAAPDSLPQPQRAAFEARWSALALAESGWMGGPAPAEFPAASDAGRVALLRLPGSQLMGWHFGDGRELGLFLTRTALDTGNLSRCRGELSA